ncbi:hypothetical protein PENSPDRAFT_635200 [Peniophora sp. CONT]|nr:hypothetical protein PENSPDRAFT_635200 [Peniophora sp. CONT]
MSTVHAKLKDFSSVFFEQTGLRRSILLSYWAIVLLAVPLWLATTSIERLPLPAAHFESQSDSKLDLRIHLNLKPGSLEKYADDLAEGVRTGLGSVLNVDVHTQDSAALSEHPNAYTVEVSDSVDHPLLESRHLLVPTPDVVAQRLSNMLLRSYTPYTAGSQSNSFQHLVAKYSPRYRLAFTLLNEDAAAGQAITGWDVEHALARHVTPVLRRLSALHNFTIESQVHFHAPLAFEPVSVSQPDGTNVHGLSLDDLKVFVNSAEWSLASQVSNDPVLHFLVFIPSAGHTPLRILNAQGEPTDSNAFILPQWGGIVIANQPSDAPPSRALSESDLDDTFALFRKQLLTLVGVSDVPSDFEVVRAPAGISDWQLDTLYRQRALENVESSRETLQSILKLVDQIPNMPVGQDVTGDFQSALDELELAYANALESPTLALGHSARALTLASRAFFNPGMLALLYFPPEHTYAVYTPLFAPMMVPLVVTAFRELSAWVKARKEAKTKSNSASRVKVD